MDERDGKGVLTLANQTVFDGYFKYGLLEGKGLAIYEDGSRYGSILSLAFIYIHLFINNNNNNRGYVETREEGRSRNSFFHKWSYL